MFVRKNSVFINIYTDSDMCFPVFFMRLENIGCKHNDGKRFLMSVITVEYTQNVFRLIPVNSRLPVAEKRG